MLIIINQQRKKMEQETVKWKAACVAKWDEECKTSNDEIHKRKFSSETNGSSLDDGELIYIVRPYDTLAGIALKYNVEIETLKLRNNLSSEQVYFRHEIIVPHPKFIPTPTIEEQRLDKIEEVLKKLRLGHDREEFIIGLLDQSSWDTQNAISKYYEDIQWEKKYEGVLATFENKKHISPFFRLKETNTV